MYKFVQLPAMQNAFSRALPASLRLLPPRSRFSPLFVASAATALGMQMTAYGGRSQACTRVRPWNTGAAAADATNSYAF